MSKPRKLLKSPHWSSNDGSISDDGIMEVVLWLTDDYQLMKLDDPAARTDAAGRLQAGEPAPQDIEAILAALLPYLRSKEKEPDNRRNPLLRFLLIALERHVQGRMSIEQAFGLTRSRRGNPGAPMEKQRKIARAVLEAYLRGGNLEAAALAVGKNWGIGKTRAGEYLRANDRFALRALLDERARQGKPWGLRERRRLESYVARRNRALDRFLDGEKQPANPSK